MLIEEGLAVPFVCGATHCPKTPRPWCNRLDERSSPSGQLFIWYQFFDVWSN
jgi:hypothetical protein